MRDLVYENKQLQAEVKRLTAEVAECIRKRGEAGERNIALTAERDRLAAELAEARALVTVDQRARAAAAKAEDK